MTSIEINLIGHVPKASGMGGFSLPGDRSVLLGVAIVVLGLVLAVGGNVYVNGQHQQALQQEEQLQADIKELDAKLKELADLEKRQAALEARRKVLTYVTGKAYPWSTLLDALRAATPRDDVTWETLALQDWKLNVSGTASDHRAAAFFLASLQALKGESETPLLEGVSLQETVRVQGKDGTDLIRFKITGQVRP